MNKYKVYIEGYEVGFRSDTLGTREKIIKLVSGETVSIDENFIYKSIEQEKVTNPQVVADWIEHCKVKKITLAHALYRSEEAKNKDVYRWIFEDLGHQETFALAWIFGYKVEKEKKYIVTLKSSGQKLYYHTEDEDYIFSSYDEVFYSGYHTKTDLEENDMSWVFDCPGMEIQEVE
jgi:phage protein|nr:MAG TPA: Protein of unknown function (DUF1642) [Caudoviricetes sp.]